MKSHSGQSFGRLSQLHSTGGTTTSPDPQSIEESPETIFLHFLCIVNSIEASPSSLTPLELASQNADQGSGLSTSVQLATTGNGSELVLLISESTLLVSQLQSNGGSKHN